MEAKKYATLAAVVDETLAGRTDNARALLADLVERQLNPRAGGGDLQHFSPPAASTADVSWLIAEPPAGSSSRIVIEYEMLGAATGTWWHDLDPVERNPPGSGPQRPTVTPPPRCGTSSTQTRPGGSVTALPSTSSASALSSSGLVH